MQNEPMADKHLIWTAGDLKQHDCVRIEPAADDDVLDAVQAWIEAGAPRGCGRAATLLKAIEQAGLYRERCIEAHEERVTVVRVAEDIHSSREAERKYG
jgi:hypothetical protein